LATVTLGCLLPADPDCLREATVHQDTKPAPARSHSLLAQLYQVAPLNGDFCGLRARKCESNQWSAIAKGL
jgi:hypothetical protein